MTYANVVFSYGTERFANAAAKAGIDGLILPDVPYEEREEFDAKALAWYYAEILKDARKDAGLTQRQLADKVGKKREYIALLEKGETDMQLSTFLMITQAVGMKVTLSY